MNRKGLNIMSECCNAEARYDKPFFEHATLNPAPPAALAGGFVALRPGRAERWAPPRPAGYPLIQLGAGEASAPNIDPWVRESTSWPAPRAGPRENTMSDVGLPQKGLELLR